MPTRRDVVQERLRDLAADLKELYRALTRDPKQEARKERVWKAVAGVLGALATMAARRAAGRAWGVLTGEKPPTKQKAP